MDISFLFRKDNTISKPYPTLSQAWTIFGVFLFLQLFLLSLSFLLSKILTIDHGKHWLGFINYIIMFSGLLVFVAFMLKARNQKLVLPKNRVSPIVYLLVFSIMPLSTIVFEPISRFVDFIPFSDSAREYLEHVKKATEEAASISLPSFLSIVIAAPILEEIICRGVILEGLLKNEMKPKWAILWSAIIFTCFHLNPYQLFYPLVMGCFLGWVYYKTRSIWICIFMHFVNNGFAFFMLSSTIDHPQYSSFKDILGHKYLVVYAIAAITIFALTYVLNLYFKNRNGLASTEKGGAENT